MNGVVELCGFVELENPWLPFFGCFFASGLGGGGHRSKWIVNNPVNEVGNDKQ